MEPVQEGHRSRRVLYDEEECVQKLCILGQHEQPYEGDHGGGTCLEDDPICIAHHVREIEFVACPHVGHPGQKHTDEHRETEHGEHSIPQDHDGLEHDGSE